MLRSDCSKSFWSDPNRLRSVHDISDAYKSMESNGEQTNVYLYAYMWSSRSMSKLNELRNDWTYNIFLESPKINGWYGLIETIGHENLS